MPNYKNMGSSSVDFTKVLLTVIQIAMTGIGGYVASEIKEMSKSINNLNVQIASLLTEVTFQKEQINKFEERLERLESTKRTR